MSTATSSVSRRGMREGRRVWLLATDFKPRPGGIAEYLHNLWHQVGRAHHVSVVSTVPSAGAEWSHAYHLEVTADFAGRQTGERKGDGFLVGRAVQSMLHRSRMRSASRRLVDRIVARGGRTPAVYVGTWDATSHFWCEALRQAGVPYSLFVYGLELARPLSGRLSRWRQVDFRGAAELIAISSGTAELVRQSLGPDVQIRFLRPGVVPPPDLPSDCAAGLREKFGLKGRKLLLTVGRLVERKGLDLVLRSVAELRQEFPDLLYLVAGDGPDRSRLEAAAEGLGIAKQVRFLGHVDERTKWALYQTSDIFIMPNRLLSGTDWEGFGIVFLEAAAVGTPSIGGGNGGVPDAILHGRTGLLVDPEEASAISSALRQLLGDDELRHRMGREAHRRARTEFDWVEIASDEIRWLDAAGV